MIPWWGWISNIAVAVAYFIFAGLLAGGLTLVGRLVRSMIYNHKRRVTNEKARKLRLQRDDWHGYPLPKGKRGEIVITEEMLVNLPAISQFSLDKAYTDRARDLKVNLFSEYDPYSGVMYIKWWPKNRKN